MNACGQSELEKEVEDVKLLQESLRYQEDDPSQQQQALRALADILSQNRRAQDYFCLSSGLEYLRSLSKSTKSPALTQAALYTMAMATEGNDISQRALTKKNVFHMLRSNLQAKDRMATTTSAFLLLTICCDNCEGQNLARETKCFHSLCDLFKSCCLPMYKLSSCSHSSEMWFNDIEGDCLQLWSTVVVALHSLLQNPQNAQNQRVCCRLLPMIVNILQLATKQQNVILPTTSLLGAIVSGNAECQSKARLLGGLRALINLLKQHIRLEQPDDHDVYFIEHIVNTIGSAISGHGICQESAADLGLVSLLLKCLDISQSPGVGDLVAKQLRTKCILALSICVDQCGRNQQQLRQKGGIELLVELLTHEQSEEFRRVSIFVLHCIVGNSQGEREPDHDTEELEQECYNQAEIQDVSSQVASPTRDAETQTDCYKTQSVCRGQSTEHTKVGVPTGPAVIQGKTQNTRKVNQQIKRVVSIKKLKPLAKSRSIQSEKAVGEETGPERKDTLTGMRPYLPSSQHRMECMACGTVLNSKTFLSTLRYSSSLCSDHRELGAFLRKKMGVFRQRILK